jgi:hypothetical protein
MTADDPSATLTTLTAALDAEIKAMRDAGDMAASLAAAAAALDRLDAAIATTPAGAAPAIEAARRLGMRIGYNVAADVYPGWEPGIPTPHAATLAAARILAVRSQSYVEHLGNDPTKRGNAIWLLGALDLAAGNRPAAHDEFVEAAACFETAPEMRLMAQGYATIAAGAPGLDGILAQLTALSTEDAIFLRDQLVVARELFAANTESTRR